MRGEKEMINVLSQSLLDGETLTHPIICVPDDTSASSNIDPAYSYLALTDKSLLLCRIAFGGLVIRRRLFFSEIRSIKIKKISFNRYLINIACHYGEPIALTASPRTLSFPNQKENLQGFIECIEKLSLTSKSPDLKDIKGTKIRLQYFNTFLAIALWLLYLILVIAGITTLAENLGWANSDASSFSDFTSIIAAYTLFLLPLFILSLLNRFLFGRILCVANEKGLHLDNSVIPWRKIEKIVYEPGSMWRNHICYCSSEFVLKPAKSNKSFQISHFPLYGLFAVRKYSRKIKIGLSRTGWIMIAIFALLPILAAILMVCAG